MKTIQEALAREASDDCWIWDGSRNNDGYGTWRLQMVHRVVFEALVGDIPAGLVLDHLCRVRACCNPRHLEPVTQRENVMRGLAITAVNAAKVACDNGHPFTSENTYMHTGWRHCRTCNREAARRYRLRRAAV